MVSPNDLEFDGWDISSANLAQACERAMVRICLPILLSFLSSYLLKIAFLYEQVLDIGVQDQLRSHLLKLKPRPSIYCPDFIAANQADRADNVLRGTKWEMVKHIQRDIKDFKKAKKLDKVRIILRKQQNFG